MGKVQCQIHQGVLIQLDGFLIKLLCAKEENSRDILAKIINKNDIKNKTPTNNKHNLI